MPLLKLQCDRCGGDGITPAGHRCTACGGSGVNHKMIPEAPFPPHWFSVYRTGTTLSFGLIPTTCTVHAAQWRLFPDGVRALDLIELVQTLVNESDGATLILAFVDSIDSAHHLMEAGKDALRAWDRPSLEKLFAPPVVPPAPPGSGVLSQPAEPLPEGHPDSYSMEQLKQDLNARYGKVGVSDHDQKAGYVCPQCGPDPAGAGVHTLTHHTFPPWDLAEAIKQDRANRGEVVE